MHAFDVLGDPVRRRLLELLTDGERGSGDLAAVVSAEFGISHPAVSQHLKVLRESGFATVRREGTRRIYAVDPAPLQEVDAWVAQFRGFWTQRLDALATELRRGSRSPVASAPATTTTTTTTTTSPTQEQPWDSSTISPPPTAPSVPATDRDRPRRSSP